MITVLTNVECYSPQYLGRKDIVIARDKIYKILEPGNCDFNRQFVHTISCDGCIAFPGMIDGHVHIIGGGGEDGFKSRIGEIDRKDILLAGITTVVGLLGADNQTKCLKSLLAKAKALEMQGITTFIYAGSYAIPIITFTGDISSDMVLIDKVIGAGEVAISDHRSSQPDMKDLAELAAKTHIGGLISGKAGLVHIHVGDGKQGLHLLNQLLMETDLPAEQFLPTHTNRNTRLFEQALAYTKNGGNIDLTAGEKAGITVPDAVKRLTDAGADLQRVTISSDANGSIPNGGVGKIQALFDDVISCITKKNMRPEIIFPLVTENAAKRLHQYPQKGKLAEGSDADILITDRNYTMEKLFSMGKLMINNGKII